MCIRDSCTPCKRSAWISTIFTQNFRKHFDKYACLLRWKKTLEWCLPLRRNKSKKPRFSRILLCPLRATLCDGVRTPNGHNSDRSRSTVVDNLDDILTTWGDVQGLCGTIFCMQPRKHVLQHADYIACTRQRELDSTDQGVSAVNI